MLIALLIQNPYLYKIIPKKIENLYNFKMKGLKLFLEIKKICETKKKIKTEQILEFYRNSKKYYIIKKMSNWEHMIPKKKIKNVFYDYAKNVTKKYLEYRQHFLICKEKLQGLKKKEKVELWEINKKIFKKYKTI
ncbi:hypothetical protein RJI84_00215 [Buchnera aphidicola (Chaitoregma tattakana)]|uniref:hypothetical protein n=1 Tax=Buchnera aphidicola TaxID=9 RepID=UPI0031B8748A